MILKEPACPVVETLDLLIDGTGGVLVPAVKKYTYITRAVLVHGFTVTGDVKCDCYGDDDPLPLGFYMVYRGNNLGSEHPIRTNKCMHIYGWDVHKDVHPLTGVGGYTAWLAKPDRESTFVCKGVWRFSNWMEGGLVMWDEDVASFGVHLNDDMTALTSTQELRLTVLGWHEHP